MSITLSSSDLARLHEVQTLLLSPLTRGETDWPVRACEAVRVLIGSAHATMYAAIPYPELLHTTVAEEAVSEYNETFVAFDVATPRALRLGRPVVHVLDVMSPKEFYGSTLYREYAVPHRIHDPMLLHAKPEPELSVWITAPETEPLRAEEIQRRRQLLELAAPAFAAGSASFIRLGSRRTALGRVLDGIATPLLVCDAYGRVVHANAAFHRSLDDEAERERVAARLRRMAREVAQAIFQAPTARTAPAPATTAIIRTAAAVYHATATVSLEGAFGPEPMVVLQLHVEPTAPPALDDLRAQFGLTRREAEVCVLLAGRLTNREIAEQLSISPHTAERHTEKVLQKLAIHSRGDVRRLLEDR